MPAAPAAAPATAETPAVQEVSAIPKESAVLEEKEQKPVLESIVPEKVEPEKAEPENMVPEVAADSAAVSEKEPELSAESLETTDIETANQQKMLQAEEETAEEQPVREPREEQPVRKAKEEQKERQAAGKPGEGQKTVQPAGKKKAEGTEGDRRLSSAEKRLFASFVPTKGAMKRLVTALDQISLAAYTGNLIITGEPGSDTLELAKNVVKDLKAKNPDFSGRIAKITGSALSGSKKPPEELVEKLAGGVLMIEKAGEISEECAKKLQQALNQERWGILVILMDTKRRIRKLLEENPEMASFFNARFDVEALDNSTLVAYGCQYARMQEYAIDELGRLALHTRIEDMQTSDHIVTVKDVREIVDDAIDHAERKTPKHFMDVLLSRRYDDNDMIILHEGDFI